VSWLAAIIILRAHAPSISRVLRLWTLFEMAVCTLHLRTDTLSLLHSKGNHTLDSEAVTVVRILAGILVIVVSIISLTSRDRPSSTSFDPLSVVPHADAALIDGKVNEVAPPEERISEEDGASMLQWLFISWLNPLLKAGMSVPLQDSMLYGLLQADCPTTNAALAHEGWERMLKEKEEQGVEPNLWRLLWRLYGKPFFLSGVLMFVSVFLQFAPQALLNALLLYIEGTSEVHTAAYGYSLALGMFVVSVASSVIGNHAGILLFRLAVRVRAALTTLVYYKSLRLSQSARAEFSDGYIVNLMQIDSNRLSNNAGTMHRCWTIPCKFVMCLAFLYYLIGPSSLAGVAVMLLLAPANYYAMKAMLKYTRSIQTKRDTRVKLLTEVLSGMKVVKLLGWERQLCSQIEASRADELDQIKEFRYLNMAVEFLARLSPLFLKTLGFGVYACLEEELTAAKAFTALGLFDILVGPVTNFPKVIQVVLQLTVSIERLLTFLLSHEAKVVSSLAGGILPDDSLSAEPLYRRLPNIQVIPGTDDTVLAFEGAAFRWAEGKVAKEDEQSRKKKELADMTKKLEMGCLDPAEQGKMKDKASALGEAIEELQLLIDSCGENPLLPASGPPAVSNVNLAFKKGSLNCIIGPVGCGKSTLLYGALNEVPFDAGCVTLAGKVAYCSQEPFLLHASLKENILFGEPFEEGRYKMALEACALITDIRQLSGNKGDETEIGEKGLNLSGGQKAGVSLARAVYANADVYIIDDVLAAVDVHVAETMMEKCILGVLSNKTRIIVTHRAARWYNRMDQIVVMEGSDGTGRVLDAGSHADLVGRCTHDLGSITPPDSDEELELIRTISDAAEASHNSALGPLSRTLSNFGPSTLTSSAESMRVETTALEAANDDSRLIKEEDRATGAVAARIWCLYFKLVGWRYCVVIFGLLILYQSCQAGSVAWMALWTSKIQEGDEDSAYYFWIWTALLVGYQFMATLQGLLWVNRSIAAGELMHNEALWRLLRAPMSYFESTKAGRIINRFSSDMSKVDMELQGNLKMFTTTLVRGAISLGIVIFSSPYILVVIVPIAVVYFKVMDVYRHSARELERLTSAGASPIYSMFGETLTGVQTSRAFDRSASLQIQIQVLLGALLRPMYLQRMTSCWLNLRLELMGACISSTMAVLAVFEYGHNGHRGTDNAGFVGFALVNALSIMAVLNGFIQTFTSTENSLVAMERLNALAANTPQEAALEVADADPTPPWPAHGNIQFNELWMTYREGLDPALKGVSFSVNSGEKVGIVGRRGAGKSSILLALFRLVEPMMKKPSSDTHGTVLIDGLDITHLGLSTLRNALSIIPQDPVLFTGTLKSNLDPTGLFSDEQLWHAVEEVGLKSFVSNRSGQLEMTIEAKGDNLACGQKQLFCLARALLRKSKVLVLDEATANVDLESDELIQQKLRELEGVTMLTIAHRLDTIIDYDKVVVLSEGKVVECGNPRELADTPGAVFSEMWKAYNEHA